jgi:hypothetical protein
MLSASLLLYEARDVAYVLFPNFEKKDYQTARVCLKRDPGSLEQPRLPVRGTFSYRTCALTHCLVLCFITVR